MPDILHRPGMPLPAGVSKSKSQMIVPFSQRIKTAGTKTKVNPEGKQTKKKAVVKKQAARKSIKLTRKNSPSRAESPGKSKKSNKL